MPLPDQILYLTASSLTAFFGVFQKKDPENLCIDCREAME